MDRALFGVAIAWLVVIGSFDSSHKIWERYAFHVPIFGEIQGLKMLGGSSW